MDSRILRQFLESRLGALDQSVGDQFYSAPFFIILDYILTIVWILFAVGFFLCLLCEINRSLVFVFFRNILRILFAALKYFRQVSAWFFLIYGTTSFIYVYYIKVYYILICERDGQICTYYVLCGALNTLVLPGNA